MKAEPGVSMKADPDRIGGSFHGVFLALTAAATLLLVPAGADPAEPGGSGPAGKSPSVTFESISGSTSKRVILTAKAAERLGIETGKVRKEPVVLKQMVSGLIIPPMETRSKPNPSGGVFGGLGRGAAAPGPQPIAAVASASALKPPTPRATSPAAGDVWVLVTLSPAEWDRLAKDKPARLLPLATRDKLKNVVLARPSGMAPLEDMKRSMLSLYYVVHGKDHGLTVNHRMRVELQLSGDEGKRKVVPYGAIYYDGKGDAWVYVNTKPLVYERRRVGVERVVGDLAVLSDGPAVGTRVVTVGAALLYGAEIFGK